MRNHHSQVSWEQFLNPEVLRTNLMLASIFIAYYEILKASIVDRTKDFFASEYTQEGPVPSEKYKKTILARNLSLIYASLSWLQEMEAIDSTDLEKFERVKSCRNELAHELRDLITHGVELRHLEAFKDLVSLLEKIEVWWILNVEIPTNPDLADKKIDESGVVPGPIIGLRLLLDIAFGDEERSRFYYRAGLRGQVY